MYLFEQANLKYKKKLPEKVAFLKVILINLKLF
jgi:hypothetical protein